MTTYEEMAPIISGAGIGQSQVAAYFENHSAPVEPRPDPVVTKAAIVAVANAIFVDGIEAHSGIVGLSREVGLTAAQVRAVIAEIRALEAAWTESNI